MESGEGLSRSIECMDKNIFYFEKLAVWQKARMLSTKIYETTSHFPSQEKFALTDQLRRAAISVAQI